MPAPEQDGPRAEQLDLGPPRSRRGPLLGLAAALVVLLAVAVAVASSGQPDVAPVPSEAPTPSRAPSPARTPSAPETSPSGERGSTEPEQVRDGPPLVPGAPAGLVVRARADDALYRIELGTGVVVRTPTRTPYPSAGQVPLIATRHAVVSFDQSGSSPRNLYLDGRPEQPLPAVFTAADQVLPGPDGTFWLVTRGPSFTDAGLRRVDPDGTELDSIDVAGDVQAGLDGDVLLELIGRTWRIGPDLAPVKVSDGVVLGIGDRHLLTGGCDDPRRCRTLLTGADGSGPTVVREGPLGRWAARAQVSPDGRWVAESTVSEDGEVSARLTDLRTGEPVTPLPSGGGGVLAVFGGGSTATQWLPDSSAFLTLDAEGRLVAVDPRTGRTSGFDLDLPPLRSLLVVR